MATCKLHPGISKYHTRFDAAAHSEVERKEMLKGYEAGQIVLLENCGLQLDFDLFDHIRIEPHPKTSVHYLISKLSMTDYLDILWGPEPQFRTLEKPKARAPNKDPSREADYAELKRYLRSTAFSSEDLRFRLAKQIREFEKTVLRFYKKIFPEYEFYKYSINWRLTESRGESMHVDAYRTERDFHQVKLFINLDSAPRIWNTGEQMKTLISRHYRELGLEKHLNLEYHRFLEECDSALFNPVTGPKDCHFTHTTFFDRGDVWIAETRQIPHQIFFGRKMVSVQFYISPEKRVAPELSMESFVRDLKLSTPVAAMEPAGA